MKKKKKLALNPLKAKRERNLALMSILLTLAVLFYIISFIRIKETAVRMLPLKRFSEVSVLF